LPFTFRLPRRSKAILACSLLVSAFGAQAVQAASADAWAEFQQDVEQACREAAKDVIQAEVVQVDPYGSESYGFAVLVGPEIGTSVLRLVACAYDKASQAAEVSGPFTW
jgi:hypothetical protein